MRHFINRTTEPFTTRGVLSQVAQGGSGVDQISVADMRTRIKLLDALDAADGRQHVELEDDLHTRLMQLLESFKFAVAHRDIMAVVDDVTDAADGPAPKPDPKVQDKARQTADEVGEVVRRTLAERSKPGKAN